MIRAVRCGGKVPKYNKMNLATFWSFLFAFIILHAEGETYLSNVPPCGPLIKSYVGKNESFANTKSGTFSSPNFPQAYPKTHCRYDFLATSQERIQIAITDFDLYNPDNPRDAPGSQDRVKECGGVDVLSSFDYVGDNLARIDDFCGSMSPLSIMSSGNKLTLEFNAPITSRHVRGFTGHYSFIKDFGIRTGRQNFTAAKLGPCTFIFNSSETTNGTFTSPNYPGLYPRNTECHYLFHGKEGEYVELYFTYFHIDGIQPCDEYSHSDYVEFSNYMPVDRKFDRQCGTMKDLKMKSDRKFFRVTFRSNDRYDATGFHATYQFNKIANHLTIRNVRSSASASGLQAGLLPLRRYKYLSWDTLRFSCWSLATLYLSFGISHMYSFEALSISQDLDILIYCVMFFFYVNLYRYRVSYFLYAARPPADGFDII